MTDVQNLRDGRTLPNFSSYVTHLYKTSHMSQKHKLSFSYVLKEEKMGFNLVQKIFICDNYLQSYARLNALNTENVNSRNSGSKFSLKNWRYSLVTTINYYPIPMKFCTVVDVCMFSNNFKYFISRSSIIYFLVKLNCLKNKFSLKYSFYLNFTVHAFSDRTQ